MKLPRRLVLSCLVSCVDRTHKNETTKDHPHTLVKTNNTMYNPPDKTMKIKKTSTRGRKRGAGDHSVLETVYEPRSVDVICGKDKRHAKHAGNRLFRELIEDNVANYMMKDSKQEKMKITKQIVQTMRQKYNSRFLRHSGDEWQEISDQVARDKVSHALRFASKTKEEKRSVSERRRKQKQHQKSHRRSGSNTSYASTYSEDTEASTPELLSEYPHSHESVGNLYDRQQQILSGLDDTFPHSVPTTVGSQHEFNTLRSCDFDDLLKEPLFDDQELEAMEASATAAL